MRKVFGATTDSTLTESGWAWVAGSQQDELSVGSGRATATWSVPQHAPWSCCAVGIGAFSWGWCFSMGLC